MTEIKVVDFDRLDYSKFDFSLMEKDKRWWYWYEIPSGKMLLALDGKKVVSLTTYELRDKEVFIDRVVVTPKYRGKGIAKRLVSKLEVTASKLGKRLYAYPLNDEALRFFHRIGFKGEVAVSKIPKGVTYV